MRPTRAEVLAAIQKEPHGISTAALAVKLRTRRSVVSNIASKLAARGRATTALVPGSRQANLWKAAPV